MEQVTGVLRGVLAQESGTGVQVQTLRLDGLAMEGRAPPLSRPHLQREGVAEVRDLKNT